MPVYQANAVTFNTTAGAHTNTMTPSVGNLLIVIAAYTGGTASSGSVSDDQAGGTYTKVATALKNASADTIEIFIRDNLVSSAVLHTITQADPPGADTGGGLTTQRWSGFNVAGSAAFVQAKALNNQTVNGVPAVTFDAAPNSANPGIGCAFHTINSAVVFTAPTSWTERQENSYGTPATAMETVTIDAISTGSTVTWAAGSATQPWCALIAEFQAGTAAAPSLLPPHPSVRLTNIRR
jgi:hypothetical protein